MGNHANHDPVLSYSRRAERAAGLFPERSEVGLFFRPAGPVDGKIPPCQGDAAGRGEDLWVKRQMSFSTCMGE